MNTSIPATKQHIRQQARWLRDSQFQTTIDRNNQMMLKHLQKWVQQHNPMHIGLYAPMPQEADTLKAFDYLQSIKKTCWFPKVEGQTMTFFHVSQISELQKGAFNILEPTRTEQAPVLDLLLVPALAIAPSGHRLGFGKGYYDRFIQIHAPKQTMAWVYAYQIRPQLPTQAHDQSLHWIATEKRIRRVL